MNRLQLAMMGFDKSVPTKLLVELLTHVLEQNIFEFNSKIFRQLMGTAMGTRVAPTMANLFMSRIDVLVQQCAQNGTRSFILYYKRYIDDILMIWTGSKEQFEGFMTNINALHPTIKFTHSFDYTNKSVTFLDTTIKITDGNIETDLYKATPITFSPMYPTRWH